MFIAEILEAGMLICFGLSWPMNAWKAYKARTAAGTSWQFLALICLGYACGVAAKFSLGTINWVVGVYLLNCVFLAINWVVYFRNRRLDAARSVKYAAETQAEPESRLEREQTSIATSILVGSQNEQELRLVDQPA